MDKFEPVSDGGDLEYAEEAFGELVVACFDAAVDFQAPEKALDFIAFTRHVKQRRCGGTVAANDDDAAGPVPAMQQRVLSACIVGLDASATENIMLLLEILGWSVANVQTIAAIPNIAFQLVFIDGSMYLASATLCASRATNWLTIVLVWPVPAPIPIGIKDARFFHVDLPLDIALLESIIESAS